MTENEIIDVQSSEVLEEEIPATVSQPFPVKTKEERAYELERLQTLKKLLKQKRRYYKSSLYQVRRMDYNK
jgi:hypothetical protein